MATRKTVAAITIPSDQNFATIATAIFNGDRAVASAMVETENMLTVARATSLTGVATALTGFPLITEDMWKASYGPGLSAALKVLYGNDNSAKSTLTRWKRAILSITAGMPVNAGETLNGYLDRLDPSRVAKRRSRGHKSVDKGSLEQLRESERNPQLPVAPPSDNANTAEEMVRAACKLLASISDDFEDALASAIDAVFMDEANALAFLAWYSDRAGRRLAAEKARRAA